MGGPRIRLGAGGPSIKLIFHEIICFQKGLYLNHSPYALREQKNREKAKREIQQWIYCTNVKELFFVSFMIKSPKLSRHGFNMFQARSVLRPHIILYEC